MFWLRNVSVVKCPVGECLGRKSPAVNSGEMSNDLLIKGSARRHNKEDKQPCAQMSLKIKREKDKSCLESMPYTA